MSKVDVLDHGYVELIQSWGSDEVIIEAARMSTGKGFQGWGPFEVRECPDCVKPADCSLHGYLLPDERCDCSANCRTCKGAGKVSKPGDEKLLRFLWEHKHHTPFEMAGMTIEVQAPIFVFREWHRHRTQSYNELSARYTQMPNLHYVPSVERIMEGGQGAVNRQSSAALAITSEQAEQVRQRFRDTQQHIYDEYEALLKVVGLAKELARINTPVSRYSRMRASANLRNWLGFLTLRMAPNAQWEIRQYANALGEMIAAAHPRTWELFAEGLDHD